MAAAKEVASTQNPEAIVLASAGELDLLLPIVGQSVSAIGFHPVQDDEIISLEPAGKQLNKSVVSGIGDIFRSSDNVSYYIMEENADSASPTASMDVGAPYGTAIFSPVDGSVVGIKSYDFAGECPDTEIRIQPTGQSRLVVVLTHVTDVEATLGQPVRAGVTRLGAVNKLDGCLRQKLSEFTSDSGNHVHMQVELYRRGAVD